MMAMWQPQKHLLMNYSIRQPLNERNSFTIVGKHSGDKESINIMANMTCYRGGSRIYKRGGGLSQGTNLLGRGARSLLELGGSGGMPPQEILKN